MKKFLSVALSAAAIVCLLASVALAVDPAADGLKLNKMGGAGVVLNHSTHKALDCKECHHKWDGAGAIQPCSAAGCHDVFDKKDKSEKSYYKVMHDKKASLSTCLSCHADKAPKEKKKELTGCKKSACHPQ